MMVAEEFIEILDMLAELNDPALLEKVALGRKEYAETGGIPFKKLREDLGMEKGVPWNENGNDHRNPA